METCLSRVLDVQACPEQGMLEIAIMNCKGLLSVKNENLKTTKVLVVCMGNICRSPTGEAVLRAKAQELGANIVVDSAGTIAYHAGEKPDERSRAAGEKRGYDFSGMRARQVTQEDFVEFDYILCADRANLSDLQAICPNQYQSKLSLFLSHGESDVDEIPDPYYGGRQGFELVIDLIENASLSFIRKVNR